MPHRLGNWRPDSWQQRPVRQQPRYADQALLAATLQELAALPPIVTSWEIEELKRRLAAAQQGRSFVLQGGDCAESFTDCNSPRIVSQLKILLQMSVVITAGLKQPVTRIGRLAGQYAKPRSADLEERGGQTLPSYRGDLVNRAPFSPDDREPDPRLLLRGYERAALTLNFVRGLIDGGFADLHHPENWDLDFMGHSASAEEYHRIVEKVRDGLAFFESISGRPIHEARRVDFFVAHEGLHLLYEQAQTRFLEHRQAWYDLTTHFPWIGMRTADPDGAHVEFFRGVANPIGVKVGEALDEAQLQDLVRRLNPESEPGRLTLIHRFGAGRIAEALPRMLDCVRATGIDVLWVCDPMHGNTRAADNGLKTRSFEDISAELSAAFRIHSEHDSRLGGVHLELTGEHVTECTGGPRGLTDSDLDRDYRSTVDPRLNYEQAMEIALQIAGQS